MFFDFITRIISKIIFFCSSVGGESFPKPLSEEDETKFIKEYKENGDENAKQKLIEHNLRLVAHIVKKYQGVGEQDDLISVGSIGLIKAINTYEYGKGTRLPTFAARCIENEILMLIRSNKKYKNTVSLNDVIGTDKDGNELTVIDLLPDESENFIDIVEDGVCKEKFRILVKNCLDKREYEIISLRYGLEDGIGLPQREVASLLGISRSYISRIEKKAIIKIKNEVKNTHFLID